MPVGIENLATGFLQGLNARKQQERQDVLDQREAERFDMQKEQFAGQQAANQLSLKTNQFQLGQAQTEADRKKILQEEADNFHKKMKGYFSKQSSGDYIGFYGDLEKDRIASGINGQFLRDEKGNIAVGADGSAIWTDGTLKGRVAHTPDSALEEYYNAFNPEKAIESRISARAELAKENRAHKQKVELVGLQAANTFKLADKNNKAQDSRLERQLSTQEKIANIRTGAKSEASYEPLLPLAQQFFGSKLTSKQLKSTIDQISKDEFIANGMQNFKLNNVGKYIRAKDMQQAEQSLNQLADSLYGQQANSVTQSQTQNNVATWLMSQNIVTQDQLNDAVRELRSKNWTDDQINSALDEVGL